MKLMSLFALALCMTFALSLVGCAESGPSAEADEALAITTASNRVEGSVEGMDCKGCVGSVCDAAEKVAGVTEAHVDLATGKLIVAMEEGADAEAAKAEIDKAISALSDGKFTVSDLTAITAESAEEAAPAEGDADDAAAIDGEPTVQVASYTVEGMTCGACSAKVTEAVSAIEGVDNAYVCHKSGTCTITAAEGHKVCSMMVAKTIEGVGFTVAETCDKGECEAGTCDKEACEDGTCDKAACEDGTCNKAEAAQANNVYAVTGMTCTTCSAKVTEAVTAIEGVESAYVCHKSGTCTITAAEGHDVCPKMVAKTIEDAGFKVTQ